MSNYLMLACVLFPIFGAVLLAARPLRERKARNIYVLIVVLINSAFVLLLCLGPSVAPLKLMHLSDGVSLLFNVDGMTRVFGCIVGVLWPLTAVYAFDYMKHEKNQSRFFAFFLISYGIVVGVSLAGNMVSMYLFFELLTLATLPLVMHNMDDKARFAGRRYLIFSMSGAAVGFIAIVFVTAFGGGAFVLGGTLDTALVANHENMLRVAFTLAFFGFGVKAALFPMCAWLPSASVAPTPVTALLHAVAVVKAGVFACIRLTFYSFGTELLIGTFAQYIPMVAASITIVYGSAMALRENHLKRRLAWSTVSNLSYILLGVTVMSADGLIGAAEHMIFHAFIKITLFFCIGAVIEKSNKQYLDQIDGMHKQMPVTFLCFSVASVALVGVPPFPAFFSKFDIGTASATLGTPFGYIGVGALAVSALLTVLYLSGPIVRAYYPTEKSIVDITPEKLESRMMSLPIVIITLIIIVLGLCSGQINELLQTWILG